MRVLDFLFFCRPLLLIPIWTVYLLLNQRLQGIENFSQHDCLALLGLTSLAAGAYVINQIFDRDSDRLNKKLGFLEESIGISLRGAWVFYILLTIIPLMYAVSFAPQLTVCFTVLAILGALYSSPPVRAKDRPILGWLFNAVAFSIILWWGILAFSEASWLEYSNSAIEAFALFLAISSTYAVTTIPDAEGDRLTAKRTVATIVGVHWTLMLAGLAAAGSLILAIIAAFWALALSAGLALTLIFLAIVRREDRFVLMAAKAPLLALSVGAVIAFPLYGLFLVALISLTRVYYLKRWGMRYPSIQ